MKDRLLNMIVSIVITVAFLASAMLVFFPSADGIFNHPESFKAVLQLLFVAILGGAVALSYRQIDVIRTEKLKELELARERRSANRTRLEEFYKELINVHHRCKKIRRHFRAFTYVDNDKMMCERNMFETLMHQLEDVQLSIEGLYREVDASRDLFQSDRNEILTSLKTAEKYLRAVVRQYEANFSIRRHMGQNDPLELDQPLMGFLSRGSGGDGGQDSYFEPLRKVQKQTIVLIQTCA